MHGRSGGRSIQTAAVSDAIDFNSSSYTEGQVSICYSKRKLKAPSHERASLLSRALYTQREGPLQIGYATSLLYFGRWYTHQQISTKQTRVSIRLLYDGSSAAWCYVYLLTPLMRTCCGSRQSSGSALYTVGSIACKSITNASGYPTTRHGKYNIVFVTQIL